MISNVQIYVHWMKGVEIDIAYPRNITEMRLLSLANKIAVKWIQANVI